MTTWFRDDQEIVSLVQAFESRTIHPAEFKHYQHLAVALWYMTHAPFAEATSTMRDGIQKLAAAYHKTGYHETITLFWLTMVRNFLDQSEPNQSIAARANRLIESCGDKDLIYAYYSRELLNSATAKEGWVAPDLKALEDVSKRAAHKQAFPPACGACLLKS